MNQDDPNTAHVELLRNILLCLDGHLALYASTPTNASIRIELMNNYVLVILHDHKELLSREQPQGKVPPPFTL